MHTLAVQKAVVCDCEGDGNGGRGICAFMGGIDITAGRYDNGQHNLFPTDGRYKDDWYQVRRALFQDTIFKPRNGQVCADGRRADAGHCWRRSGWRVRWLQPTKHCLHQ